MASRSSSGAVSSTSGSTFTNTVSGASSPCATAPRNAAARQISSNAASAPARAGGGEELVGSLEAPLRTPGERLVGDHAPVSSSTIGWNTLCTAPGRSAASSALPSGSWKSSTYLRSAEAMPSRSRVPAGSPDGGGP